MTINQLKIVYYCYVILDIIRAWCKDDCRFQSELTPCVFKKYRYFIFTIYGPRYKEINVFIKRVIQF